MEGVELVVAGDVGRDEDVSEDAGDCEGDGCVCGGRKVSGEPSGGEDGIIGTGTVCGIGAERGCPTLEALSSGPIVEALSSRALKSVGEVLSWEREMSDTG
jgi:hypothetical protein